MSLVGHAVLEVIEATLPVLALILFFQLVVLRRVPPEILKMLIGAGIAMAGFFLFILGAKISLIPMGIHIGDVMAGFPAFVIALFAFVLGIAVIFAEPAVRILAVEIEEVSSGSLRKRFIVPVIALGVGVALVFAVIRILNGLPLAYVLVPGYGIILVLTLIAPKHFVPIAFDSGAVATGPVAVNFVLPITTGMAIGLLGEGAGVIGFGVVGIIAMFPIIFMLIMAIVLRGRTRSD
ncbi:DUF1538 domain-containing protein [soil metagenome]